MRHGWQPSLPVGHDPIGGEERAEGHEEPPKGQAEGETVVAVGQSAADRSAREHARREFARQRPVDVAKGPVGHEGLDGKHCNDHQAGADRLAHPQPEYQQVEGHEQEPTPVSQQTGKDADARHRDREQEPVLAS